VSILSASRLYRLRSLLRNYTLPSSPCQHEYRLTSTSRTNFFTV